jgi:membrane protease subunit HflK
VLVDQKSGGGNLLYLPLDKLIQSTNPGADVVPAAAKPTEQLNSTPSSEVPAAQRGRESMLSREREAR